MGQSRRLGRARAVVVRLEVRQRVNMGARARERRESTMREPQEQAHVSRRMMIAGLASGATAVALGGRVASAADDAPATSKDDGPAVRNQRINQTVCEWCYKGKLSLEQLCAASKKMGLRGIDLVGPDAWPTLKKY